MDKIFGKCSNCNIMVELMLHYYRRKTKFTCTNCGIVWKKPPKNAITVRLPDYLIPDYLSNFKHSDMSSNILAGMINYKV